jgi:hypothetical protein
MRRFSTGSNLFSSLPVLQPLFRRLFWATLSSHEKTEIIDPRVLTAKRELPARLSHETGGTGPGTMRWVSPVHRRESALMGAAHKPFRQIDRVIMSFSSFSCRLALLDDSFTLGLHRFHEVGRGCSFE